MLAFSSRPIFSTISDLPPSMFSPPILSIIFGGLFILIGIAGAIEFKGTKIPQIGVPWRILAFAVGSILLSVGIFFNLLPKPGVTGQTKDPTAASSIPTSTQPLPSPQPERKTESSTAQSGSAQVSALPGDSSPSKGEEDTPVANVAIQIKGGTDGMTFRGKNKVQGEEIIFDPVSTVSLSVPDADFREDYRLVDGAKLSTVSLQPGAHPYSFHVYMSFHLLNEIDPPFGHKSFEGSCSGRIHVTTSSQWQSRVVIDMDNQQVPDCSLSRISQ